MRLIIQHAHRGLKKSNVREDVTVDDVIDAFDQFDWVAEVSRARESNVCTPTIALVRENDTEELWISAYKDRGQVKFTAECHIPNEAGGWFSFAKKLDADIFNSKALSKNQARLAVSTFANQDYSFLRQLFSQKTTEFKVEHTKA